MPIDVLKVLNERFPGLTLDAGLFYRWPVGIRFDLGGRPDPSTQVMSEVLHRATALYEELFATPDKGIVIAQDWPGDDIPPPRYTNLFDIPGTGLVEPQGSVEVCAREQSGDDHSYTLRWSQEAARGFQYRTVFTGLANADHGQIAGVAISSRVYFLHPQKRLILHMYDDRGLDVIGGEPKDLYAIYREFNSWILDYDRSRIDELFMALRKAE
jgi:hypothetical protein